MTLFASDLVVAEALIRQSEVRLAEIKFGLSRIEPNGPTAEYLEAWRLLICLRATFDELRALIIELRENDAGTKAETSAAIRRLLNPTVRAMPEQEISGYPPYPSKR